MMLKQVYKLIIFSVLVSVIAPLSAQVLTNDTLIIGSVNTYPGQSIVVPVYISTSLDYQGWQIPIEFYGADTSWFIIDSVSLEQPDSSCMVFIPDAWDFIVPFKNNDEWSNMISCGVAGVVSISPPMLTLRPGYYIVMNLHISIDSDAPFNTTIPVDTTTSPWSGGGPANSYAVTVGGSSYQTIVRAGSITISNTFDEDTLIIGNVEAYPGQTDVRVPVYSKVSVMPYAGWTVPIELYGVDTNVVRIDSFSTVNSIHRNHPVVGNWSFISTFKNNYEWPVGSPIMSCGVAGVVSFMTVDSVWVSPDYHLVGEVCVSIDPSATPQTIPVDTTTTAWYSGGPLSSYNLTTNQGRTYYSRVRAGSITIRRAITDDTLIIGDNAIMNVNAGETCTLTVYMKNTQRAYQGWQLPVQFYPFSNSPEDLDASLELDSTALQNSVMLNHYNPLDTVWDMYGEHTNNYEWPYPVDEDTIITGGVWGIVWFTAPPAGGDSLPTGTHTAFDLHFRINNDAIPQTVIIDSTVCSWNDSGPAIHPIATIGGMSWKFTTRPCTLSINGHLWNDTLIIGNVVGYPGDTVRVPVYMKNAATGINSWNMPFTFGNGSAPVTLDSINYLAKDPTWNYFMITLLQIDNTNQNCAYGGMNISPNPVGYHKILELKMIIDSDATPQTITIDTTTTGAWGSYSVNSSKITNVIPGSIEIKGLLGNDTLIVADRMIHPGTKVTMPLYMRSTVSITQWTVPLTYGDGSTPIVLDSIGTSGCWPAFGITKFYDDAAQKCALQGLAWPTPNPPGYNTVMKLHFTCLPTAPTSSITIDTVTHDFGTDAPISYNILSSGLNYMTIVRPGNLYIVVGAEENKAGNVVFEGVYPTVARGGSKLRISYMMPGNSKTSVRLYDVVGRRVCNIYEGTPENGILDISYTAVNLSNGVYFLKTENDEKVKVQKIVVTR